MEDHTYFISEVSRMVGVEPHVLRYWEEELDLHITRNSQGKRCYGQADVELFREVKYWKDKGMQLKAVKEVLDHGNVLFGGETGTISGEEIPGEDKETGEVTEFSIVAVEPPSDSRQKFEQILDEIVGRALERNNEKLLHQICDALSQELEDRLEMKLEELLQRELLQEMLREGEREAAAAKNDMKPGWWARLRKWRGGS